MKRIIYITATLPALTVTFIYNEIFRLRSRGAVVDSVSMNTPAADSISADSRDLRQTTVYLDAVSMLPKLAAFLFVSLRHPVRMASCLRELVTAYPVKGARDYARLVYHLVEGAYLARRMRHKQPEHLHSHFINGPTSIAMFMARLLDIPYSFTMHASMIWRDPIAIRNKLRSAAFCVSISEYNRRYVLDTYGQEFADKIHIVHCGVEPDDSLPPRQTAENDEFRLLAVGQLNPRKGFHVLIPALAGLRDKGVAFHCTIVGDGAERSRLAELVRNHALGDHVNLAGAMLHEKVKEELAQADAFVLPCVITDDGWRDGIPVALMEAMLYELPVVSTNILGLPELIEDGVGGLLVPANDADALSVALARLAEDPGLREKLGQAGRVKVLEDFNNVRSARELHELIEGAAS